MESSVWNSFLQSIEQDKQKFPTLVSIIRQAQPVEMQGDHLVLSCENNGTRMYLEKKKDSVEQLIATHLKQSLSVEFVVQPKKHKEAEAAPLLQFQPSKEDLFSRAGLHTKYRFENFAVSGSNQVAYAASQAVAQNPGTAYNPLFLYGGVGVGKTHLAQAVARYILERNGDKKVFFCPGDQFTNELIESIREHTTPKFRRKYRQLNLLLIDDIQFIAGKNTVQEEFFHTFNAVVSAGGQVILTSDRPPHEIKNLEDRLRSRFSGGLIVDVQPPDFELRTAILLIKAKEKNIEIDMEAAQIIAEQVSDTRALEGTLLSVYAKIIGRKDRIDLEVVGEYFDQRVERQTQKISSNDIIRIVCSYYNIKPSHIKSATRVDDIAMPRQIIMYLLRTQLNMTHVQIANILKRKDHTTIMHGVEKINRLLVKDVLFKQEVDRIISTLHTST